MISINEGDAAVFISLLHASIKQMRGELAHLGAKSDNLNDEELQDSYELQECIEQYSTIMANLREDYEAAIANGVNLPDFATLTQAGLDT